MQHFVPLCGLALITLPVLGQTALSNQGAVISIQAGTQVAVQGDVSIGAGGTIDNAGTLSLTGHWANNTSGGVLTPATGTVQLNGPAAQQIGGSGSTTFHTLDVSTATGPVQLAVNTAVGASGGVLALGATTLQLNARVLTLNNGAPTALTRTTGQLVSETSPTTGYGRLVWAIGAGTGTYVIPFGTGTAALPVTLTIGTAGVGAAGSLDAATYPTPPANTPLPTGVTSLQGNATKALDRFWVIQPTNYTTAPVTTLALTYQDVEWNASPNTITESRLRLQRWNGSFFEAPQGAVNPTTNVLTSATPTGLGIFAAADLNNPLPVELREFTAVAVGRNGVLDWSTASEKNNQGFDVEASLDGKVFVKRGFVAGHGTTSAPLTYRFLDENAAQRGSFQYYRLRQVDADGTATYSPVRPVRFADHAGPTLAAWPNPTHDTYTILLVAAQAQLAVVRVHDAVGRLVREQPVQLQAGDNQLPAAFGPDVASGVYLLSTVLDGQEVHARLVRE
jgi:hypothetical protein